MSGVEMCSCESVEHNVGGGGHDYMQVPAGDRSVRHLGPVCDACAEGHAAPYLLP